MSKVDNAFIFGGRILLAGFFASVFFVQAPLAIAADIELVAESKSQSMTKQCKEDDQGGQGIPKDPKDAAEACQKAGGCLPGPANGTQLSDSGANCTSGTVCMTPGKPCSLGGNQCTNHDLGGGR